MSNKVNQDYYTEILESSRELTRREKVKLGSLTGFVALKSATDGGANVVIDNPTVWAKLHIHNEHAPQRDGVKNTDYENTVILDGNGNGYFTGSKSFYDELVRIWTEMSDVDGNPVEEFSLNVFQRKSQNGVNFVTVAII